MIEIGVLLVAWDRVLPALESALRRSGDFVQVESGCLANGAYPLGPAVERLLTAGVERVIVVPTMDAALREELPRLVAGELQMLRGQHPDCEFIDASAQVDAEQQAQFLSRALARYFVDHEADDMMPLAMLPPHQKGAVHKLLGGHDFISRLAALGFIPGAPLVVEQNFGVGPLIVAVRDTRIALGRAEAHKIRVRLTQDESEEHENAHHHRRGRRGHFGKELSDRSGWPAKRRKNNRF